MAGRFTLLLLAVVLALPGCVQKQGALRQLQARVSALDSTALCGTISDIEIEDARAETSERALRVPRFTWRGEKDQVRPPLNDELRAVIRSEVSRRVHADGPPYWVRVRILEGVQRFRASRMSEEESATWSAEVMLQRQDVGRAGTTVATAELEFSVASIDASRSFSDTLSRRVLQAVLADAFSRAAQPMLARDRAGCTRAPARPVTLFAPRMGAGSPGGRGVL